MEKKNIYVSSNYNKSSKCYFIYVDTYQTVRPARNFATIGSSPFPPP